MSRPKSAVTKAVREVANAAQETDLRRQRQIDNQTAIINRLMEGGGTYDDILQRLNAQVAELQVRNASLEAEIAALQADQD